MAWWMAAATVASTIAQNEADRQAGRAASKSLRASAKDKLRAADSTLYASTINRSLAEIRGRETQSSQVAAYASNGVDISSGSVYSTLANTESQILRNDFLSKFKATAEADLLRAEAGQLEDQAKLASKDKTLQNIITGGLSVARSMQ